MSYVADEEDTRGMDACCDDTEWAVGRAYSFYKAWDLNGFFGFRIVPIGMAVALVTV